MASYIFLAGVALVAVYLINTYRAFRSNLDAAKRSGIPYIVSPVYTFNTAWLLTHKLWLPIIGLLPTSWTQTWIGYLDPNFIWNRFHDSFQDMGCDAFMIVSPGANSLFLADPGAITQVTTRRNDFPKPTWMYRSVDLFGKNLVSSEGAVWRQHRKVTSPPFTEKNNILVWQGSLLQAQSMVTSWVGNGQDSGTLKTVANEAMRLSLHVISKAGFGVSLKWPHEEIAAPIPKGHTLPYKAAIETLLEYIIVVMLTPGVILRNSPLKIHRTANEAFVEWGKYMREMYSDKREELKGGNTREGLDLMGALIKGAGITAESLNEKSNNPGADPEKGTLPQKQLLSDDEILGNAFVFILAGHETAANTIHFSIIFLAMHMASQLHLQQDLDSILGSRPVSQWDYEQDVPKLFGSMCGAVMNEELRLIPPVVGIPKSVTPSRPQGLQLSGGRNITVPQGAYVTINTAATHRNPKYWPHTSPEDLLEFRPERWLLDPAKVKADADANAYEEEEGLEFDGPDKRPDTAASLFRPAKGAYVPFSDGYRSCIGRRFAQVEILAVLAVIFKNWTVELDVSAYLSDAEFEKASEEQKREAWNKADARARELFRDGMMTLITIQMRRDKVPVRFVKRGNERFGFMMKG